LLIEIIDNIVKGYCGFIPGIKAGNMYGKTYGIVTNKVHKGEVHTGISLLSPANLMN